MPPSVAVSAACFNTSITTHTADYPSTFFASHRSERDLDIRFKWHVSHLTSRVHQDDDAAGARRLPHGPRHPVATGVPALKCP